MTVDFQTLLVCYALVRVLQAAGLVYVWQVHRKYAHGHAAGDAVLRRVGGALARQIRRGDTACRFGGEEFVVLMPGTSAAEAQGIAERLRSVIADLRGDQAPELPISASIGVAEKSPTTTTWERLVAVSDKALCAAKRAGRNRVVVADITREAA